MYALEILKQKKHSTSFDKVAISIFCGTSRFDQNIFCILTKSKKVVPCKSKPISILSLKTTNTDAVSDVKSGSELKTVILAAGSTQVVLQLSKQTQL